MILWITSYGRSGNTFFRIVLHHLYGVNTHAAFNASEVLLNAGADDLVGYQELPPALAAAVAAGKPDLIRVALDNLEARKELFIFKTHAWSTNLFGTNYRAILLVRDGRDALASYANYLVDIRFDAAALRLRLRRMRQSRKELLSISAWKHLLKITIMKAAKLLGLRHWLVSRKIDFLLQEKKTSKLDWSTMNQSWLEREPRPVIVYFNDLIRDPVGSVVGAVERVNVNLATGHGTKPPSFAELQARYPSFFRSGTSGNWKEHFTPAQEERFMNRHGDVMKALHF